MTKAEQVYEIVRAIPRGKVMSYGKIGVMVGVGPRQVGRILHDNPDNNLTPCHRVVRADGSIASGYAFGGKKKQIEKLRKEGVKFVGEKVDSDSVFWWPQHKARESPGCLGQSQYPGN